MQDEGGHRQFRALIENVHDAIVVVDATGLLTYASPAIERLLGLPPDDVVGRHIGAFLPGDVPFDERPVVQALRNGEDVDRRMRTELGGDASGPRQVEISFSNRLADPEIGGVVLTLRDITAQVAAEHDIERISRRFETIVRHTSDMVVIIGADGRVTYGNPSFRERFGGVGDDLDALLEVVHPEDRERLPTAIADILDEPSELRYEMRVDAGGEWRTYLVVVANLLDDPDVAGIVANGTDITEQRNAELALADEAAVLEAMARGRSLGAVSGQLVALLERHVPGSLCVLACAGGDGAVRERVAPSLTTAIEQVLDQHGIMATGTPLAPTGGAVSHLDLRSSGWPDAVVDALRADGYQSCWADAIRSPSTDEHLGTLLVLLGGSRRPDDDELRIIRRTMTIGSLAIERSRIQERLEHQALHDTLTDLPNRVLLLDRVAHALDLADVRDDTVAVLFVDLDDFKVVNDSLGHAAGDTLLRAVAERLRDGLGSGRTLGRFGGDEFLVVCDRVDGEEGARAVAEQVSGCLAHPFVLAGSSLQVRASIGIALSRSGVDPGTLVREADVAMYQAKDRGRNRHQFFRPEFHHDAVSRLLTEQALGQAVAHNEVEAAFQPIACARTGRIVAVEALARWRRSTANLLGADQFVPLAEDIGIIDDIDDRVLQLTCMQLLDWDERTGVSLEASVNLSARRLQQPDLLDRIVSIIGPSGLDPARLTFEITERAFVGDLDATMDFLAKLRDVGARVAIDDFGTGYASMDYLLHFSNADYLKVDQTFIRALRGPGPEGQAIVAASVGLGHTLDMIVVAEGIESPEELRIVADLGFDRVQGFLIGEPVPAWELEPRLDQVVLTTPAR